MQKSFMYFMYSFHTVIFLAASRLTWVLRRDETPYLQENLVSFIMNVKTFIFLESFGSCFLKVDILLSSGVSPEYLIKVKQTTFAQVLLVQLKSNNLPGDECGRVRRLPAGKVADRVI